MASPASGTAKLYPSKLIHQYTVAQLADVNAIKTAIATATSIQTYTGAAINGALAISNVAYMRLPQAVSMTASAAAGHYVAASTVVFTGTDWDDAAITDTLTVTDANGGWTVSGNTGFKTVSTIVVAAQANTGGQWEFGVTDVLLPSSSPARQIRHGSAGNIVVGFEGDDNAAPNTTLYRAILAGVVSERHDGMFRRIFATSTTSDPVTIYL
jgi:hypothetical protein